MTGSARVRSVARVLGAFLIGPLAWAMWVLPFGPEDGYVEPWGCAAFFITVAVGGLAIRAIAVRRFALFLQLAALSWVSVMVTVLAWWSAAFVGAGWGLGRSLDRRAGRNH